MQPRACADGSIGEFEESRVLFQRDVLRVERVAEMVLRFDQRRAREFQVSGELLGSEPTESFSDRPWRTTR
jgi:hypothetical protein